MDKDINGAGGNDDVSSHMGSRMHQIEGAIQLLKQQASNEGINAVQEKLDGFGVFLGGRAVNLNRSTEFISSPEEIPVPNEVYQLDDADKSLLKAAIASAVSTDQPTVADPEQLQERILAEMIQKLQQRFVDAKKDMIGQVDEESRAQEMLLLEKDEVIQKLTKEKDSLIASHQSS